MEVILQHNINSEIIVYTDPGTLPFPPRFVGGTPASAWANNYAVTAAGHATMAPAVAYSQFVETGVMVAGVGGRALIHTVPYFGAALFAVDGITFGVGFKEGWTNYASDN